MLTFSANVGSDVDAAYCAYGEGIPSPGCDISTTALYLPSKHELNVIYSIIHIVVDMKVFCSCYTRGTRLPDNLGLSKMASCTVQVRVEQVQPRCGVGLPY